MITGTVTDQTPSGRLNTNYDLDFALKGTPAISDEDMSAWMQYLFQQRPMPADAKGVEVTLDTLDPNNNFIHIGTTTSDTSGKFSYMFTPEVPGKYTIIATFMGSESYYASYDETALGVLEAPVATPTPTPTPLVLPPYETYTVGAAIAVIIAIAIVGILLLRKRS
jgi:hypothetical protein